MAMETGDVMYLIVYINGYGNYGSAIQDRCPETTDDLRRLEDILIRRAIAVSEMSNMLPKNLPTQEHVTIINIVPLHPVARERFPY